MFSYLKKFLRPTSFYNRNFRSFKIDRMQEIYVKKPNKPVTITSIVKDKQ